MTLEEAEKRIAELEAEVAKLKAFPPQVIHSHYHYMQPQYVPQPTWGPVYPQIWYGSPQGAGLVASGA